MSKKLKKLLLSVALTFTITGTTASTSFAWDSREDVNTMDTHKTIATQALEMIRNDKCSDVNIKSNLDKLQEHLNSFKKGAVAPDFGDVGIDRDYYLYQDHFYNPDTGKNFTSSGLYPLYEIPDTAESQTRNYVGQAIASWNDGNYDKSAYLLGKAMHYFADLNEPHHASNLTGGVGTAHTKFETFAEEQKNNYKISSVGANSSVYTDNSELRFDKFLTAQSYNYAKIAKSNSSLAGLSNSWDDWYKALDVTLKNGQKGCASVIYRFLQEVTYPKNTPVTAPIGNFHVVISVADETGAGTDDYMYFGMKLKDGRTVEFNCDLPGNDFERNTTSSFEFEIKDATFNPSDITNVYLRKQKYVGDDIKLRNFQVYMQTKRVVNKDINQWLSGNTTYSVDVSGLN